MKALAWLIVASVGFAVMVVAYAWRERGDSSVPWASGLIIINPEAAVEKKPTLAGAIPARLRLLSSSDIAELVLFAAGDQAADKALGVKGQVRVKLIEVPLGSAGIGAALLQWGRLPEAGHSEALAGTDWRRATR